MDATEDTKNVIVRVIRSVVRSNTAISPMDEPTDISDLVLYANGQPLEANGQYVLTVE